MCQVETAVLLIEHAGVAQVGGKAPGSLGLATLRLVIEGRDVGAILRHKQVSYRAEMVLGVIKLRTRGRDLLSLVEIAARDGVVGIAGLTQGFAAPQVTGLAGDRAVRRGDRD